LNGPITETIAQTRVIAPNRVVDDAVIALVSFANGSAGTFEATRFGIGCKNRKAFEIHGSSGMLRFNLEELNRLQFLDFSNPSVEQGVRDVLVTDMKHPIFGSFWRPGHIIGYEHTFIAALSEFLDCLSKNEDFHPNFADGLAVQEVFDAVQRSANTRQWTTV
jgi:predicted dehydrogenase